LPPRCSRIAALVAVLALTAALAGCGGSGDGGELRLGYFPNITHGPALIGLQEGVFDREVTAMPVKPVKFATGTEAVAAMLAGSLDASYIGMGPVITTLSRAPGSIRVLSGVGEAGADLVVRRGAGIRSVAGLRGRKVGFPGFGNTQDMTVRLVLQAAGLSTSRRDPDVRLVRIRNADLTTAFQRGALDAALPPEPWGSVLEQAGLADVLVPADRILGGHYPTTVLVVRAGFADEHPRAVAQLAAANRELVRLARDPRRVAGAYTAEVKGNKLDPALLLRAIRTNIPTTDVNRAGTAALLRAAEEAGYMADPVSLEQLLPAG